MSSTSTRGRRGSSCGPTTTSVLARLRAEAPVFEFAPGVKAVSRYHDIRAISRDPASFCSGRGALVNDPLREGGSVDGSILHMDPPEHGDWRRILNREFTGRAMERNGRTRSAPAPVGCSTRCPRVRWSISSTCSLHRSPSSSSAICSACPTPTATDFRRWSDATIVASDGRAALSPADAARRHGARGVPRPAGAGQGGETPGDDIVSLLVGAEVDGRPLEPAELMTFNMSLLVAGNETTRHLISGGMMALAEHPDQRAAPRGRAGRDPGRSRGVPALGHADPAVRPHRDVRLDRRRRAGRPRATTS